MKNVIVTLSSMGLLCACGMGAEGMNSPASSESDALLARESGPGARLVAGRGDLLATQNSMQQLREGGLQNVQRGEYCTVEMIRPTVQGTIQAIPKMGVFGVAATAGEVQSSYFRSNGVNEEFRRGIAEFYVPGEVSSAILQFREHRGWTSYPSPADTHDIQAYPGNLELDVDDYSDRAVMVGRFETDPNLEPSFANSYDLTKPVQEIGAKLGLRFEIEGGVGSGTAFMDLALQVTRCKTVTH